MWSMSLLETERIILVGSPMPLDSQDGQSKYPAGDFLDHVSAIETVSPGLNASRT